MTSAGGEDAEGDQTTDLTMFTRRRIQGTLGSHSRKVIITDPKKGGRIRCFHLRVEIFLQSLFILAISV